MTKGFYGSNGENWPHGGTPDWLMEELIEEFGEMHAPCPLSENPEVDGLQTDWPIVNYVNPPYTRGQIGLWVKKCHDEWVK